jgi:hypothetical protein
VWSRVEIARRIAGGSGVGYAIARRMAGGSAARYAIARPAASAHSSAAR